jgi:predicted ATPase/signal transduction histidine kinase
LPLGHLGYTVTASLYASSRTLIRKAIRQADGRAVVIKSPATPYPTANDIARYAYACDVQSRFDHPGIVKVLGWLDSGAAPAIVLEDSGAMPLRDYVVNQYDSIMPIDRFLDVAIQLSVAVGEIHYHQVIHKDLHPGNILIQPDSGQVQITDFDIASVLSREQPDLKPPEVLEGMLGFISPEQTGRMNRVLDYRTDFYSLGVTFYWLLSGRLPFEEPGAIAMVHAHIARQPALVNQLRPEVPLMIGRIVDKLMAKNAEARYQNAAGLKYDLQCCLQQWRASHSVPDFVLGQQDVSDRFQLSQKLYGREEEIAQLLNAFSQARKGSSQLVTVTGYSGIGKSALVHEIHKPIAAHGGWYVTGKFDQFKRNIPYSALHQAFKTWELMMASEGAEALSQLRTQLRDTLGASARVLIDFLPDLASILGSMDKLPVLGAMETQNRFHRVIQQFIQIITRDQPLVLFLDDMQWADMGTLNLLKTLMIGDGGQLLLIVAYRDNEVSDTHPLMLTLAAIEQDLLAPAQSRHCIALSALPLHNLRQLLKDSFHTSQDVDQLAQLIMDKTAGNPFFVNEFIRMLYSESLIDFNFEHQQWQWDVRRIQQQAITDNVVELMLAKMLKLPEPTQHLMQLAACMGDRFDVAILALVAQKSTRFISTHLWPAIQEGLLLLVESDDQFIHSIDFVQPAHSDVHSPAQKQNVCRFLHDRMLQAAYDSIDPEQRKQIHLSIARILQSRGAEGQALEVFAIAEHFNEARSILTTDAERLMLAELNYAAALQAKQASVWSAAANHSHIARDMLASDSWQARYQLAANIYLLSVECEILNSNFSAAEQLAQITLRSLTTNLEKARICLLLLSSNIVRGQRDFAIEVGIEGLKYCGILVPDDAQLAASVQQEQDYLHTLTAQGSLASHVVVAEQVPAEAALAARFLSALLLVSFVSGRKQLNSFISCRSMRLLLDQGLCEETAALLCQYAVTLLREAQYPPAFELTSLALDYTDGAANKSACLQTYFFSASVIWFHFRPFDEAIELLWKGFHAGMEYGDTAIGVGCFSNIAIARFSRGDALADVASHILQLEELMIQNKVLVSAARHYLRLIRMLQQPGCEDQLQESSFSPQEQAILRSSTLIAFLQHLRLQWYFWSEQFDAAIEHLPDADTALEMIPGMAPVVDHAIIKGVLLSLPDALLAMPAESDRLQQLATIQQHYRFSADHCAANFEHKYWLVSAQIESLHDNIKPTIDLYRRAIAAAREHGFVQYEALGNELLGRYLWRLEWYELAIVPLKEAHYLYGSWGCTVKQDKLVQGFPDVFDVQSVTVSDFGTTQSYLPASSRGQGITASFQLDLESILKSTEAISSELVLDRLLNKVLHIILENAGAQSGSLVLSHEDGLHLEARLKVDADDPAQTGTRCEAGNQCIDDAMLPLDLIRYVLLSDKPLLLQDVANSEVWSGNAYIKQYKPQSILCLPMHYRDSLTGVLYLENTLTTHAFTDERLQVLELLLTQVTISLENARLFDQVNALNANLESKVEQRTAELLAVNRELEAFSYSVSHDLRGPLRNINGFSKLLLEKHKHTLTNEAQDLLRRVSRNTKKMSNLISGLLALSDVTRSELHIETVDLADMARSICHELNAQFPNQNVRWVCIDHAVAHADPRLLYSALENMLNNAWKYSSKSDNAEVEFGVQNKNGTSVYFVKDNGAGFDMRYVDKLFTSFQRLHRDTEFQGTGIGLATVQRIIARHNGEVWAESELNKGATFFFTLATHR